MVYQTYQVSQQQSKVLFSVWVNYFLANRYEADHLQCISPLLLGICDEEHNRDELLLPTFRALACVLTLARFHVHTSETLSLLKEHIVIVMTFWYDYSERTYFFRTFLSFIFTWD